MIGVFEYIIRTTSVVYHPSNVVAMMIPVPFRMKRHFEGLDSGQEVILYTYDVNYYLTMDEYLCFCEENCLARFDAVYNSRESEFVMTVHQWGVTRNFIIVNVRDFPYFVILKETPEYKRVNNHKFIETYGTYDMDCLDYSYPLSMINWWSNDIDMRSHVDGIQYNFVRGHARVKNTVMMCYWASWGRVPEHNKEIEYMTCATDGMSIDDIVAILNRYPKTREMTKITQFLNIQVWHVLLGRKIVWNKTDKVWFLSNE